MSRENEVWDVPGHTDLLLGVWDKPGFDRGRHRAILDLTASYVTTDKVLDAGCGMGHFYPVLKLHHPEIEYIGFDNSIEMLKKAHEFFPEKEAFFVYGDIYDMSPFPIYPSVVCIDILIHLPDIEAAIKEMWKHVEKELILVTRVDKTYKNVTPYSGVFPLPAGKNLIVRGDVKEVYMKIFNSLSGDIKIEEEVYDERSTLFRVTRIG